jgi:hypothetical protein
MIKHAAFAAALAALTATSVSAQNNPRGEAKTTLGGKTVAIDYGRPSLKGRDMLGKAEVGSTWRMGADGETTLKTETDLKLGTATVPKGEYVLTAKRVSDTEWAMVVSKADKTSVAEVPLAASKLNESVEMFTIDLAGQGKDGTVTLKWGTTALQAPVSAK